MRTALRVRQAADQLGLFDPRVIPRTPPAKRVRALATENSASPYAPHACVALAVDTAKRSGWAVRRAGKLVASGACAAADAAEIDAVIAYALDIAAKAGVKCVLVLERAWGRNTSVLVSLGMARGYWLAAWRRAHQPATRVVSVYPVTWRAKVLGKGGTRRTAANGGSKRKPTWDEIRARRAEQERVELAAAYSELRAANGGAWVGGVGVVIEPDEAAAILISRWAAHAADVGNVLARKRGPICTGCRGHVRNCGPALWRQQRKCCPDCSHADTLTRATARKGGKGT